MRQYLFRLYHKISNIYFRYKGFQIADTAYISRKGFVKIGGGNVVLDDYSQINSHCFLLAFDTITIGKNSTLAYQTTILTSANPNYPYNKLSEIYQPMKAPVYIGDNVWIGARSVILPGVRIGNNVVVAAGSVVTKNVPDNCMVAGVPAVVKKRIEI